MVDSPQLAAAAYAGTLCTYPTDQNNTIFCMNDNGTTNGHKVFQLCTVSYDRTGIIVIETDVYFEY